MSESKRKYLIMQILMKRISLEEVQKKFPEFKMEE